MDMMNVLIVANGDAPSKRLLDRLKANSDLVIAADGGANTLFDLGHAGFTIIGDLDSVRPEVLASIPEDLQLRVEDQDTCDLEKAINHCANLRADRILITGATGGRLEHTLTSMSLLYKYAGLLRMRIISDYEEIVAVPVAAEIAVAGVLLELLSTLDDIERAAQHGELTGGFKSVSDQLIATTTKLGLEKYGQDGDEFDPQIHEALMHETSSDVAVATASKILQPGYKFKERVLRPARVAVTDPE